MQPKNKKPATTRILRVMSLTTIISGREQMNLIKSIGLAGLGLAVSLGAAQAETRVVYKSAKSSSSYYQMSDEGRHER